MVDLKKPEHDRHILHGSVCGDHEKVRGVIIHTTESDPRPGASDRHGVASFLKSIGLGVPVIADNESSTLALPDSCNGQHVASIDGCKGVEQIGRATWKDRKWLRDYKPTIEHAAQWAAYWLAEEIGVAVTKKTLKRFVVGHDQDYKFGGTSDHWDPGWGRKVWAYFRECAIAYAKKQSGSDPRYRLVASKEDEKKMRTFKTPFTKKAKLFIRKWTRRGWRVFIQRKPTVRGELHDVD